MLYRLLFVKQKTAYEMRISDWSSDVCSSDLDALDDERHADEPVRGADELHHLDLAPTGEHGHADGVEDEHQRGDQEHHGRGEEAHADLVEGLLDALDDLEGEPHLVDARLAREGLAQRLDHLRILDPGRSEERRVGKGCGRACRYRWSP